MHVLACARLLRRLAPWADGAPACDVEIVHHGATEVAMYRSRRVAAIGSYVVAHGMCLDGLRDARIDRLARALASAGFVVAVPTLRDFSRLRVTPSALDDLRNGLAALRLSEPVHGQRVGVFSASFGSLPAIQLAAAEGDSISGLIVFGGCANFTRSARFALGVRDEETAHVPVDKTCGPAIASNMLAALKPARADVEPLLDAWLSYTRNAWKLSDPSEEALAALVGLHAEGLSPRAAKLFRKGCGVTQAHRDWLLDTMGPTQFEHLSLEPWLARVRCPVHIMHGAGDNVIPVSETSALRGALSAQARARVHVTGMFAHSASVKAPLGTVSRLWREGATFLDMVRSIVNAGTCAV